MSIPANKKLKIFNDPVYGFIGIPDDSVMEIIETPFFQRLRMIKQLGLSHLVYPGALHTRFQHAMGSMYLMQLAIEILRSKGHEISTGEALAVTHAILLHDIGHGPFSHALENALVYDLDHEDLTLLFMEYLAEKKKFPLELAISIFRNEYEKKFLHQLVSGQLDMDRLDYLHRDSFFTGVSEGVISWDRIIKMLNVSGDKLVIDEKGIYSIEKFIIARRLMYWQVYLHKTVIAAENTLHSILKRAKLLALSGEQLFATPPLRHFLYNKYNKSDFAKNPGLLEEFARLDDYDIFSAIKTWTRHPDRILAYLCQSVVNRKLPRIKLQKAAFSEEEINMVKKMVNGKYGIEDDRDIEFFVCHGTTRNHAYDPGAANIMILSRDGSLSDLAEASDQLNISALSRPVEKYFISYPKELGVIL